MVNIQKVAGNMGLDFGKRVSERYQQISDSPIHSFIHFTILIEHLRYVRHSARCLRFSVNRTDLVFIVLVLRIW